MESGARAVSHEDLVALLEYFNVDASTAEVMKETARAGRKRRESLAISSLVKADYAKFQLSGFIEFERDAVTLREFNSGIVPGLLQSSMYMQALMWSVMDDPETVRSATELRDRRRERLEKEGKRYSVVIDEAALARVVGDFESMAEQMQQILDYIDGGKVDLRVISFKAGMYEGVNNSFVIMDFEEFDFVSTLAFSEAVLESRIFDRPDDVEKFEVVWGQAARVADSPNVSREIVQSYLSFYRSHRS